MPPIEFTLSGGYAFQWLADIVTHPDPTERQITKYKLKSDGISLTDTARRTSVMLAKLG